MWGFLNPPLIGTGTGTGTAITRPTEDICDYSSHRKHLLVPQGYDLTALEPIGPLLSVDLPLTILSFLRILEVVVLLTVTLR